MEVKLSYGLHSFLPLPKSHLPNSNPKSAFPTQSLKGWVVNSKRSFEKYVIVLAKRWRFPGQEMLKAGQSSTEHHLVHLVKEAGLFIHTVCGGRGETLTSISKQYGVSVDSIAEANKSILYVDLLFKGRLLNIPASAPTDTRGYQIKKRWLPGLDNQGRLQGSMNILDGFSKKKPFIMLTAHGLPHACPLYYRAKSTGYFLALVPFIAFCIGCIIGTFHTRVRRDLEGQALNESRRHHDGPRSRRWKYALSDITDDFNSESVADSNDTSAGQDQNSFEDASHEYSKLELDYQKFLSECGISKWGYWRGGSLK